MKSLLFLVTRPPLLLVLAAVSLCIPTHCQAAGLDAFQQQVDTLLAADDSLRLDSLVAAERYTAYTFLRSGLETYFDKGDKHFLRLISQVALAVEQGFGDRFYLRQIARYELFRSESLRRRRELKAAFEAANVLSERAPDSAVALLLPLADDFLQIHDSTSATTALQYAASFAPRSVPEDRAFPALTRAIAISRTSGDLDGLARSFILMGNHFKKAGDLPRAGAYFDSARVLKTELKDDDGLATCLNNIASVYFAVGEIDLSYSFATEALRKREELADSTQVCQSLLNLITAFRQDRSADQIRGWLAQARAYSCDLRGDLPALRLLQAEAVIAEADGDLDSARGLYLRARNRLTGGEQVPLEISLLMSLAAIASDQGDYTAALQYHLETQRLADSIQDRNASAKAIHNIGVVHQKLGDDERAAGFYLKSVEIKGQLGLPNEMIETLNNLAEIYLSVSDYPAASKYLTQSTTIARAYANQRLYAASLTVMARLKQETGDWSAAYGCLDSVLAIYTDQTNMQGVFDIHLLTAEFARLDSDFATAQKHLAAAAPLLRLYSSYANLQKYDLAAGQLWYDRRKLDSASIYLARVIARLESSRRNIPDSQLRASQKSEYRFIYEKMALIFADRYRRTGKAALLDSLTAIIELAKSRSLLDLMSQSHLNIRSRIPAVLLAEERQLLRKIEDTEAKLAESTDPNARGPLLTDLTAYNTALTEVRLKQSLADPAAQRLFYPDPASVADISERLADTRTAVLDFLLTPEKSLLLVVSKSGKKLYRLPPRTEITDKLTRYLDLLRNSVANESLLDSLKLAGAILTRAVLGEFGSEVKQFDKLLVCGDGALTVLPFESLIIEGKYLIQHADISLLPSLQLLSPSGARKQPTAKPRLLAFADPQPEDNLKPLPYSLKEAQSIATLFDERDRRILTGSAAVKSALASPDASSFDYIHFATHSSIDEDDPSRSKVWLSPDSSGDSSNYLSLADVMRLDLPADLVVLSSCESGGGRFQLGEGIEGFVKGFMYAGCRNIVVSLWEVDDATSATFMKTFYQNLSRGYSAALRQAKIEMIESPRRRYRHPLYWAPFVLVQGG